MRGLFTYYRIPSCRPFVFVSSVAAHRPTSSALDRPAGTVMRPNMRLRCMATGIAWLAAQLTLFFPCWYYVSPLYSLEMRGNGGIVYCRQSCGFGNCLSHSGPLWRRRRPNDGPTDQSRYTFALISLTPPLSSD
ncbi:hypothetical protein IF2G_02573 [Cordyceps javanica]|nr:hypothetical protein IF2G_02573 [Cordyceps javanica]